MKKIIILAEPRTGSHLLVEFLRNAGYKYQLIYNDRERQRFKIQPEESLFFVHTHYTFLEEFENYQQIITYRKNVFDQLTSLCVASITGQFTYTQYKNNSDKFYLDLENFDKECNFLEGHKLQKINAKKRKKEILLDYETISKNPNILKELFDINYDHNNWQQPPSPNRPKNLLKNYEEIKKHYYNCWYEKFQILNQHLNKRYPKN